MPTPHNSAKPGDYADAVLLPGDPLRAKYIAETYLDEPQQRNGEPHCPTASWQLIHGAVHAAKEMDQPMHVGPIVSSDLFYNPSEGQYERWSQRGVLAVEMEAAALFTVAAVGGIGKVQGVHAGCLLTVSDIIVEGVFTRITDDELRAAVDRMTRVALATVTSD